MSVLLLAWVGVSAQEPVTVTGQVFDNTKQGIPGVTVALKGVPGVGAATDYDGKFVLKIPATENPVLVFSFVGMKTVEVAYSGQPMTVTLQDDAEALEAVVVTGIFERKAESFTGSVATYKAEDLKAIGTSNVLQSLKSLDPAFQITPNNLYGSDPNRLPDIDVRGKSGIVDPTLEYETDPNQPLFILDGIEVSLQTIVDLPMDRVASVTILKDASSTAIYGSRAANGVIVMETVRPQSGELQISYGGSLTVEWPDLSDYNMMNAREKLEFEQLAGAYRPYTANDVEEALAYNLLYNARLYKVQSGVNTYWLSEPVRTGLTHKHNLFLSGGDDAMVYGFGLNYANTQGVMKESGNEVMGLNLTLRYRKGKFMFNNNFTLDHRTSWNPPVAFSTYVNANPFHEKTQVGDIQEYLGYVVVGGYAIAETNPLYNASLNHINGGTTLSFRENFQGEWRPSNEIMVRGRLALNKSIGKTEVFKSPYHTDYRNTAQTEKGSYSKSTKEASDFSGDLSFTYAKVFNEIHNLNFLTRAEFGKQKNTSDGYSVIGFSDDNVPNPSFANQYPSGKPSYSESEARRSSFIGILNYMYANRYAVDFTMRYDGASNFGANNRYTTTWSAGLAWNLHNENFIGDWAQLLKLRFSVGNPGNANMSYYTNVSYKYNALQNLFGNGVDVNNFGNANLKGEKTMDYNGGIDLAVANGFFKLTTDIYRKMTDPVIVNVGLVPSTGMNTLQTNYASKSISGLTINATITPINRPDKDLVWALTFNGRSQNSEYGDVDKSLDVLNEQLLKNSSLARIRNGSSEFDLWAVRSAGIDPATGSELYIKKDGSYSFDYSQDDEVIVGSSNPTMEGRIGSNLRYKGWTVNMAFHYIWGADAYNNELRARIEGIDRNKILSANQDKRALYDRWKKPGDIASFRRIDDHSSTSRMTDRYLQKKNWFAGESITVGYDFKDRPWLKSAGISTLTLRAYMNDIFKITTIKQERGLSFPFSRSVSFSMNMTF
ncbi:MAG: SusC/RagA family TonB-linked outer membrane protein [Culturomica sp.]|nr:SusC/RagA family TonB-linked outer membrane protein [Culturomica sp.]